jgi:Recombination endonuclease VII
MSKPRTEEQRAAARARTKAWNAANPERKRATDKAYHAANRERLSAYHRAYHEANRDRELARSKAWYAANRERAIAQGKAYRQANPERKRATDKAYYEANRAKIDAQAKVSRMFKRHGLTPEAWAAIWQSQDGRCYLGGESLADAKSVHIDHDHSCCPENYSCDQCRRGLACNRCNVLIGLAGDDPERLRRIADNLDRAAARIAALPPPADELALF